MSKNRIILVGNDSIEAMDIKRTLELFGFEIPFIASSGEEAVGESLKIVPDLVIVGMDLKGQMNSIEIAKEIVKQDIPVICLTDSDETTIQKAKITEPYVYLIKPYSPNELKYAIELALYKNKMDKKLKSSQRQLSAIIDSSPVLQFVIDKNHKVTQWNYAMANYSGISPEEVIGTDEHWKAFYNEKRPCLADLIVDEKLDVIAEWYSGKYKKSENLKGALEVEDFFPSMGKNGKWLHFTVGTIKDGEGNIIGALETLEDITERINAGESLKKQNSFIQSLIDTIPYPLFYKDANYAYMGCNSPFEEFIGLSKNEIIGKTVYDINPKELADKFHQKDKDLFKNPGLQSYEAPVQYADGSKHMVLFNKATFNDEDGRLAGLIGIMVDITERKNAEKALKHSEAEYRAIFENIKSAVVVYNAVDNGSNFIFKDFNRAAEDIEQIKREEVIGKKVTEIFPGVVEFGIFEVFQRVWKTGKPEKHPVSIYKDERIEGWRENYIYKLPSGDIVAVYDDLTGIKQYEEELERNEFRLKIIVKILQYQAESVKEFLNYALEEAIKLTESKIGYICHYQEDKKEFIMNTWSGEDIGKYMSTDQQMGHELDKIGLWGEAVRQRKPIVLNDFQDSHPLKKGYPQDHVNIHNFMTIPVFSGDEIVAVVGVANKETNYTETDVLQLELLMDAIWKVVDSQKVEEALKESETRYKAIFENTGTATVISENDMTLSLVNEEFSNLTGYSKEEIENKMIWTKFFVEKEIPKMKKYHSLRRVNPTAVPKNYESQVTDINGNVKDVFISATMIPDTKKSVLSILDITDKKRSRIELRKELEINQSLARIYVPIISTKSTMEDITVAILEETRKLTRSRQGFVSSIDPKTSDNIVHSLSKMMPECDVIWNKNEVVSFHIGSNGLYPSLWGHCLNEKKSFFTNNAEKHPSSKGAPEGHVKIEKFLGIPVLIDNEIAGEIALANPDKDYSDEDIKTVERVAEFFAMAIQRKRYEEQISNSLEEKVVLLREIHHRVKNNLQIISSILSLQSSSVKNQYLTDIFEQNQNRIKAMAMIHEKLYGAHDLIKIDFSDYLKSLTSDIMYTYLVNTEFIDIKFDLEDNIMLNIETAIPLGLIFSELFSNSMKHAFMENTKGEIKIKFKKLDENFVLTVSDNGKGLPDEIDFHKTESLGFQLVNSLVDQLEGTIELDKNNGTTFIIKFKELEYKKRI